jgi:hypothetical protein
MSGGWAGDGDYGFIVGIVEITETREWGDEKN